MTLRRKRHADTADLAHLAGENERLQARLADATAAVHKAQRSARNWHDEDRRHIAERDEIIRAARGVLAEERCTRCRCLCDGLMKGERCGCHAAVSEGRRKLGELVDRRERRNAESRAG